MVNSTKNEFNLKKTIINSISVVVYLLLLKSIFEIGTRIWNREFTNWATNITNGDLITIVAAIIGMLVISHKMRTAGKSKSIDEENRKHLFYRVVILLVVLVGTIAYNKPMFKVGLFEVNLFVSLLVCIIITLILELIVKKKSKLFEGDNVVDLNNDIENNDENIEYTDERQ